MSRQSQDDQVAKQAREQIAYCERLNMVNSVSPEEKSDDDHFDDTPDTQSLRSEWG
jgi:hypothetical protein